jgi:hypothetical protein
MNEEQINSLTDEQLLEMAKTTDIDPNLPDDEKIKMVKELLTGLASLGKIPGFSLRMEKKNGLH